MAASVNMHESWKALLLGEFDKAYFKAIKSFLLDEKSRGIIIYPPGPQIFAALDSTPVDEVKVVIIGQDPYHGLGQANGLCFSVSDGIKPPPSLVNIYKEIEEEYGVSVNRTNGNLEPWAQQGVLLLNAILTVRANEPASHQQIGWQLFTDEIIKRLSKERDHLVFLLWGKYAQSKEELIDSTKHLVLKAAHPSPFSAFNGFFGCRHFISTNAYLTKMGKDPIDWIIK
jgi:uracil-DNA glycosylase